MLENFVEVNERKYTENQQETIFKIDEQHEVFSGHFPDKPVTPGVVLIDLFKKEAEVFFQQKLQLIELKNVKFIKPISPQKNSLLSLASSFSEEGEFIKIIGKAFFQKELCTKLTLILKKV